MMSVMALQRLALQLVSWGMGEWSQQTLLLLVPLIALPPAIGWHHAVTWLLWHHLHLRKQEQQKSQCEQQGQQNQRLQQGQQKQQWPHLVL
jgi:hypothetical protein